MPSAAHQAWYERAMVEAPRIRRRIESFGATLPISTPVIVDALFFRDANRGDAAGYYQALSDWLERAGILANDKLIAAWDGSRLLVDREFPRIEVRIVILETGL
jgi:glycine/D-amino acid oxidase-like deaminating enzyme